MGRNSRKIFCIFAASRYPHMAKKIKIERFEPVGAGVMDNERVMPYISWHDLFIVILSGIWWLPGVTRSAINILNFIYKFLLFVKSYRALRENQLLAVFNQIIWILSPILLRISTNAGSSDGIMISPLCIWCGKVSISVWWGALSHLCINIFSLFCQWYE